MNAIQTGAAARENPGSLHTCDTRPASPSCQDGKRSVALLTGPATTGTRAKNTRALSSPHKQAASQATVENQDLKRLSSLPDLGSPHLAINYPIPNWRPPEKLIERPVSSPTLEKDEALTGSLHQIESLSQINKLLEERSSVERDNGEFKWELLMPSLRNMRTFIGHIRDGHQFTEPLTDGESKTLVWLAEKTQALLDANAPYKRTVHLAIALMTLCEIITQRQVLDPLQRMHAQENGPLRLERQRWIMRALIPPVDPAIIMACCWGGNNPGGLDESEHLFRKYEECSDELQTLTAVLDDNRLLAFPSFQPLTLNDFCRFGHLRVHPIGMTTDYACNADGYMMSPLQFAKHDIGHMLSFKRGGAYGPPPPLLVQYVLCCPYQRLRLRCLLLDQLPGSLAPLKLDPALMLLLFQFLHELRPDFTADSLNYSHSGFVFCLWRLTSVRRGARAGYAEEYQSVTDTQAARAALWTLCLWRCWQAAGFGALTQEQQEACARDFEHRELPRLERHLKFIKKYRSTLRLLFANHHCSKGGQHSSSKRFWIDSPDFGNTMSMDLFRARNEFSGLCNLDNTDVIYFHALNSPVLRQQMESVTGASLPEGTLCMADFPPPLLPAADAD